MNGTDDPIETHFRDYLRALKTDGVIDIAPMVAAINADDSEAAVSRVIALAGAMAVAGGQRQDLVAMIDKITAGARETRTGRRLRRQAGEIADAAIARYEDALLDHPPGH